MQQRQLRLGDILDDYCPRERRVTNHVVVAMIGEEVKQSRCTTCEAEHEYKHAKVPRQRRKNETPSALYAQVLAGGPKRVAHEHEHEHEPAHDDEMSETDEADTLTRDDEAEAPPMRAAAEEQPDDAASELDADDVDADEDGERERDDDNGPIHRRLIRASLPRPEGQQPPARPIPEFTIRQPGGGRPNRFRPRHQRGGGGGNPQFQGNRSNGNVHGGPPRGMRQGGGRPQNAMPQRGNQGGRHQGHGRKRSK